METPLIPVWVVLPELPWYCYFIEVVAPLLFPIGKALYLDLTTYKKTRESVAKVKVQIDLTKVRTQHVWMGYDEDKNREGRWQVIQYEDVPEYCSQCKHQGQIPMTCTMKRRNDEARRKKEMEEVEKHLNDQMHSISESTKSKQVYDQQINNKYPEASNNKDTENTQEQDQ